MNKSKLLQLNQELKKIALLFPWPSKVPAFSLRYLPQATGASINLDSLVITLGPIHSKLPLSLLRVPLAHEIAHHYQEVINYRPSIWQAIYHRLGSLSFLVLIVGGIFALSNSWIFIASSFLAIFYGYELLKKAQLQLIELASDHFALQALQTPQEAICYFGHHQMQQNKSVPSSHVFSKIFKKIKNFIDQYLALLSTHPTYQTRIQFCQKFEQSDVWA